MDERTALHTAARRYCLEHAPGLNPLLWEHIEARLRQDDSDVSEEALAEAVHAATGTPTQESLFGEILFGLERLDPEVFGTIEDLREAILSLARGATPNMYSWTQPMDLGELEQERARFCRYVDGLAPVDLRAVEPLFHRRVLPDREADKLWRRINRRWGASSELYWYPLRNGDPPAPDVLAFNASEFWEHVPDDVLQRFLTARRIRRLWELQWDYGVVYEIDLELLDPASPSVTGPPRSWTGWCTPRTNSRSLSEGSGC